MTAIQDRYEDTEPLVIEPKQARSRLSTSLLLRASAELIAEVGYERMTLAEVGLRAGYSHGLVTQRFGSKDGLLLTLLQKMVSEWHQHEIAPALGDRVGVEAIAVTINAVRTSARNDPDGIRALYALMFEAVKPNPGELHARVQEITEGGRRGFEEALRQGIAAGVVRDDVDVSVAAGLVVAGLRGAAYQWLLDPGFDLDQALAGLQDQLERALGSGCPRPRGSS